MHRQLVRSIAVLAFSACIAASCGDSAPADGDTGVATTANAAISTSESTADSTPNAASTPGPLTGIADIDEFLAVARASNAPCDSLDQWSEQLESITVALRQIIPVAEAQPDEWKGSPEARAAIDMVRTAAASDQRCDDTSGDIAAARRAAAGAAGAIDDFAIDAIGQAAKALSGQFWGHADSLGNAMEVERLVTDLGAVDALLVGDSTVKRGIDPVAFGEGADRTAVNVGTDGQLPAMITPTIDEFIAVGATPSIVVIGVNPLAVYTSCDDARPARQQRSAEHRQAAFAQVAAVAELSAERRVHGGEERAYVGKMLTFYDQVRDPIGFGRFADEDPRTDEEVSAAVERGIEQFTTRVTSVPVCEEHEDDLRQSVGALVANDINVVVVIMPISPLVMDLHPDGKAGFTAVADGLIAAVSDAGVEPLDLHDAAALSDFSDLSHMNADGRTWLTDQIIESL